MIQRIQSIFLLIVTLVSAALFFVPFVQYEFSGGPIVVSLFPGKANANLDSLYYIPVAVNIICMVFSVFIVMQYKRRIFQMKMANLLLALNVILLGVMLLFEYAKPEPDGTLPAKKYLYGAFLPIISVVAAFLAARAIKKDEDLVRSSERLR